MSKNSYFLIKHHFFFLVAHFSTGKSVLDFWVLAIMFLPSRHRTKLNVHRTFRRRPKSKIERESAKSKFSRTNDRITENAIKSIRSVRETTIAIF